ncbi:hypothetical protein [Sphingopyxis sp.]|uniref:hypothetical protein n=1 Tax=Sphingopyxis sp. TaxID=1908224 RepID=UPI00403593FA
MTLKDLDDAGKDVRAWCFECARGERVDTNIWELFARRHWPMGLDAAARQFRCTECGSSEHVRLYPATRPYQPPMTGTDMVAAIFFGVRAAAKAKRRDPITERAAQQIAESRAARNAPKRAAAPPPVLVLVWSKP